MLLLQELQYLLRDLSSESDMDLLGCLVISILSSWQSFSSSGTSSQSRRLAECTLDAEDNFVSVGSNTGGWIFRPWIFSFVCCRISLGESVCSETCQRRI